MYLVYKGFFNKLRLNYFERIVKTFGLKPHMRVLDYGCGPGDMLAVFKQCNIEGHGVDTSERSVALARKRGFDVICGDCSHLPHDKESFDAVFLQSVLEHIPQPLPVVQELLRYLKPGGLLILSSPTPGSSFWDDPTHIHPFTPKSFKVMGELLRLEQIYISYVFAFLLGLRLQNPVFYKLLNLLPIALGSNIIGVFRKPLDQQPALVKGTSK